MEKEYKWAHPHDWLVDKVQSGEWDGCLHQTIIDLARNVDPDTIQEMYQEDMDADNYFKPR